MSPFHAMLRRNKRQLHKEAQIMSRQLIAEHVTLAGDRHNTQHAYAEEITLDGTKYTLGYTLDNGRHVTTRAQDALEYLRAQSEV